MGYSKVLIGDMGGTSFDTGIIEGGEIRIEKALEIGPFKTGISVIDIISIGAGGGSIAWVSDRGVPQVGPHSARSTPGPACYDKGGEEPTVTDAMVAMGFIDPDNYLGGRFTLSAKMATQALDKKVGERFKWSSEETAAVIHDLCVVNMATAVREISIEKGHDPRDFVFLAYGGTLPMFAWQIAARLNISKVIIPPISSAFSALGLLMADFNLRLSQTVDWSLNDEAGLDRVNDRALPLVTGAMEAMKAEGFDEKDVITRRSGDIRFAGQVYDLTLELPDRPLEVGDIEGLKSAFFALYEKAYGVGTGWVGVPEMLTNYNVEAIGKMERPRFSYEKQPRRSVEEMTKSTRSVFLPDIRKRQDIPILDGSLFSPDSVATGPLIVDATDTTMYVPAGVSVTRDANLSFILTEGTN
jgi:N-methylhydantoinase A